MPMTFPPLGRWIRFASQHKLKEIFGIVIAAGTIGGAVSLILSTDLYYQLRAFEIAFEVMPPPTWAVFFITMAVLFISLLTTRRSHEAMWPAAFLTVLYLALSILSTLPEFTVPFVAWILATIGVLCGVLTISCALGVERDGRA